MAMNTKFILKQFLQFQSRTSEEKVTLNDVNSFADRLSELSPEKQKERIGVMLKPIISALRTDLKANELQPNNRLAQLNLEALLQNVSRDPVMAENHPVAFAKINQFFTKVSSQNWAQHHKKRRKVLVALLQEDAMKEFFIELALSLAAQKKQAMERMESSGPNPYHSPIADLIRDNQSEIAQDNQSAAQQAAYDASGRFYRDMIRFFAELYDLCLVLSGEEAVFKPESTHDESGRQKFLPAPPAPKPS